jgi:hypothetical protein
MGRVASGFAPLAFLQGSARFADLPHRSQLDLGELAFCFVSSQQRDRVFGSSGLLGITKEVVGIHAPLIRWLFGHGILRKLRSRVPPMKPTSVPLRF